MHYTQFSQLVSEEETPGCTLIGTTLFLKCKHSYSSVKDGETKDLHYAYTLLGHVQ